MPEYKDEIYAYLSNSDSTFADEVSPEQFSEQIDTDDNYVSEIHGYLGGLDSTFTEEVDIENFTAKMRGGGGGGDKKKEKKKEEEVKTRLDIDTSIPKTRSDVDDKYEKYLEAVQMENQTIAVDPITGLPLEGMALALHINEVKLERKELAYLTGTAQDEIEFAEEIKKIQLLSLPTEEEIEYKMSIRDRAKGEAQYGDGDFTSTGSFAGDAASGEVSGPQFETKQENAVNHTLLSRMNDDVPLESDTEAYNKYYKEKGERRAREEKLRKGILADAIADLPSPGDETEMFITNEKGERVPNPAWSPDVGQASTFDQGMRDITEEVIVGASTIRDYTSDIKEGYNQIVKGAIAAGYEVGTDKSRKDEDGYYYIPEMTFGGLNDEGEMVVGNFDPTDERALDIIYDKGEGKNSVFYQANYIANRDALALEKLNSPTLRKATDDLLEKFEDEKGVSGWNNAVNIVGTFLGKHQAEAMLGITLDEALGIEEGSREAYKQNQKELATILDLSQKGDERLIAATMWDLRNQSTLLLAKEQELNVLHRELNEKASKNLLTQEDIDQFNLLRDEMIMQQKQINADVAYLGDLSFEGTNVNEMMTKVGKTYDELAVYENIFNNSAIRFTTGIGSFINELNPVNVLEWAGLELKNEDGSVNQGVLDDIYDFFGDGMVGDIVAGVTEGVVAMDEGMDTWIENTYDYGQKLIERNRPPIQIEDIDSWSDGLAWTGELLSGQVVNTAVSCIPYVGVWLTGASEAGNKFLEMKTEMEGVKWNEEELAYIQSQKDLFGKDYNPLGNSDIYKITPRNYNALEFYGSGVIYGAAEVLLEKVKLGNLKIGINNVKRASYNLGKMSKKGIVTTNKATTRMMNLKNSGLDYIKGMPQESITEGLTQVAQNGVDKYILDKDVSLLDGVTESMLSGAVMASTLQSPGLIAQTYAAFRGSDRNQTIANRGADILALNNSLKKKYSQLAGLNPNSKEHKQVVEAVKMERSELSNLIKEQLKDQNDVKAEIMSFTKSDRQGLIDIFNKEHDIRSKIDAINDNTTIDKKVADKAINKHLQELTVLETLKNFTIKNGKWNADKSMGRKMSNAYRAKKGLKGSVKMIAANNNKQALDFGLNHIETQKGLTPQEKNALKENLKRQFDDADKASAGNQTVNGFAWGDGITIETTDANNITTEKTIDMPMTFALSRNNSTVMSHEVGHQTLFSEFVENNPDAVGLVDDLEAYVKKNYSEAYKTFQEVKDIYGTYNQKGEIQNKELVAEEKLARLSDFMRQNDLQGDRTLRNKLFGRFQKFNDGSGQIQSGKDVFDMLTSYNESFETGKLVGLTKSMAEGTAEVSRKKKTTTKETKESKPESKKSLSKSEIADLKATINEAPGPKGTDGKYKMTKDEFLNDKDRAFSKVYRLISQGKLDGLIIDKMASGKTIYDKSREDVIQETQDKLADHLMNFDPTQSGSLFGWINSYIGKRVGDVTNKAKREKAKRPGKTISTDQKIGEEGRTIGETIADDIDIESDIDANIVEDTIDNMRTKLGIEKGGPIYNKVLDSVRKVLGTKLPEVSNKKFREDLKKAFDKELFKEIKKFIGTRANYETFLSENFQTVFDTMSQSTANKRFRQFVEPLIDPKTGKQARPDNNPLFRKRDVKRSEFMEYFLGDNVGASTKGTRKDALAGAIAQELAFDATMEVLEDPMVQNRIKDIYELQGLRQAENYTAVVAKVIDRKPGAKFSVTKADGIKRLQQELSSETVYNKVLEGGSLMPIIEAFENKLDAKERNLLRSEINNIKRIANRFKKQQLAVLQNLENIIITEGDFTAKEKANIIKEAKNKIKESPTDTDIDAVVKNIAEELGIKAGFAYEQAIYDKINQAIKDYNIEGLELSDGPTEVEGAADLVSKIFGQQFNVEVKLEKPRYSSVTLIYDLLNLEGSIKKQYPFNNEIMDMVKKNKENFKNYRDRADQLGKELFGDLYVSPKKMGDPLPKEVFDMLQLEGWQNALTKSFDASTDLVSQLYWAKNNGTAYIQIKGKGLFYLRNPKDRSLENPLKLKVPPFDGTVEAVLGTSKNSVDSKNPGLYKEAGVTLKDGKLPGSKGFVSVGMRVQMMNLKGLKESDIHLDNVRGVKKLMDSDAVAVAKAQEQGGALKGNNVTIKAGGVMKPSKTIDESIRQAEVMDKALNIARDPNAPVKKIRVFDFDDTLARTNSLVFYTMPDGKEGKLTAEQFAKNGDSILEQGGTFDFSDFNQVRDGKPGPLLDVAKKIQEVRGTKDVFVLTARAPQSQLAIKQFLDAVGLNIPIENITGLGDSSPLAKSSWIIDKAAEGYNDFYFADDHLGNVDAVKTALSVVDIKSSVQQAKIKFSKTVDQTVNDIIEHKFGIKSEAEYSDVKARLKGRKKGRFKFFIPPSAEDFVGLLYSMLGKGEIGDMQMEFFKEHLIEPYGRAMEDLSRDQNRMVNDFKALKAALVADGLIPKNLNKKAFGEYTFQDVARMLAWNKQGFDIPGISKTDLSEVLKFAEKNPAIDTFAQNLIDINKGDGYSKPGTDWLAGTISTDLLDGLRTGKRAKYLQQWQDNVDLIFSKKNLNKMEAAMGSKWREAMEHMLNRMKSGKNRTSTATRLENRLIDYVNNSVGTVMFFNMRSAVLQTISAINFINWGSNNVVKAGIAFANQPQYWKDFMELMNSEFLVERRNGLKLNVSESEIADAAATSKNKAKAAIAYILQKGYLPTQFADSFAIASGGATFYRNRIKSLMKKGMSEADAKKQAFLEFREIAEESQQSSRPDRISQQQASGLGRLILAFANTPMQYNRLIKKAGQDLFNRRKKPGQNQFQSDIGNISKMAYYAVIQNVIFNALQQAVFALEFDDEEDEAEKQKYYNVANGMLDSILRGSGLAGVGVSTVLAMIRKVHKEYQKEGTFPGPDYADAAWELLNFSPPIDIKASKLRIAGNTWKYEGWKHDEANWGINDPAYKSAAYVISALTNVPVDRLFKKMDNIQGALDSQEETWKRISQALGWTKWQLETTEEVKAFREEEKSKKKQSLKSQYGPSNPEVYSKNEQKDILKQHGYSDDEIKAMKKEEDRVKAILKKQEETGDILRPMQMRAYKPKKIMTLQEMQEVENKKKKEQEVIKKQQAAQAEIDKYKKLKKDRQVEMLDSLGLSKKEIRDLQYEKNRVAKLIELMNK